MRVHVKGNDFCVLAGGQVGCSLGTLSCRVVMGSAIIDANAHS